MQFLAFAVSAVRKVQDKRPAADPEALGARKESSYSVSILYRIVGSRQQLKPIRLDPFLRQPQHVLERNPKATTTFRVFRDEAGSNKNWRAHNPLSLEAGKTVSRRQAR